MARIRSIKPEWRRLCPTELPNAGMSGRQVYIIREDGDLGTLKVGVAAQTRWRRSQLQGGNPRLLVIEAAWQCSCKETALRVERLVQAEFADRCLLNEWFQAELNELSDAVESAFRYLCGDD